MPGSRNGALYHVNIGTGILRDRPKLNRALGNRTDRRDPTFIFNLLHAGSDQVGLDWFLINPLQERGNLRLVGIDNFLQNFLRIFVARLDAFQIENGQAAKLAHRDGKPNIDNSIHGAGQNRDLQLDRVGVFARQTKSDVDLVWIKRHPSGYKRDLIKSVVDERFSISADPHSHN
jgi:hypothetical protein